MGMACARAGRPKTTPCVVGHVHFTMARVEVVDQAGNIISLLEMLTVSVKLAGLLRSKAVVTGHLSPSGLLC